MTTTGDKDLPKAVQLMWGLRESGGRGPKRGLTLDQILDAAIEVADAEGYAALSMTRVAKQLGFTAMSLYRYVDSKTMLIALLTDRVIGPPPVIAQGTPWRVGLEKWATAEFEAVGVHEWWVDIPQSGPPMGPNSMAWLDAGLRALGSTTLPETIKLQLVMNLSMYSIGRRRAARDLRVGEGADFATIMAEVLGTGRFPAMSTALAASAFDNEEIDWGRADFEFGLARMLDGYEIFIRSFEG
ncbi:TetR family transcriptional regulator [Nocardia mangyaensis]|uniref:TetR family transcriptional regulator n=1 Tax=Nocardia mangyaensis TaxID=2213200 RepID=A0A1J0VNM0_9NOCA|nr:TetR/AcrR family transcriptional regulator [Nocardia mangyaensis]APE33614.1 TetR family transcriptional regulator [Nocardia mangyaensis]